MIVATMWPSVVFFFVILAEKKEGNRPKLTKNKNLAMMDPGKG